MANEGLWQQVLELDRPDTARRAACDYSPDQERYSIKLLNRECVVDLAGRQALWSQDSSPLSYTEELCVLAYLISAAELPVSGKLTPGESLPDGQFFFRGLHKLPTEKLEAAFGESPERLYEPAEPFGAERCEFGDASIQLYVLPRVPLTVVLWRGDEEFDPRASILFDETAASQMPLDALWTAANVVAKALIDAVGGE
ncbi:MAG: DUF3786 domain-containing protein [Planctomycetota bacterium]|jgi:hypothetical protein